MSTQFTFHLLESVDSTNNYAMEQIRAGLAENGMAWQARHQTAGRGQLGRTWHSDISDNILMSIVIRPGNDFLTSPFIFNMAVSLICRDFIAAKTAKKVSIKWPNDLYINDRKAGGMLIENNYRGESWQWAVIGIGINVNQYAFPIHITQAVSFHQLTGQYYDPVSLARELHQRIVMRLADWNKTEEETINCYHDHLFKINEMVTLATEQHAFTTQIIGVDANGQLITKAGVFKNGEVKFL